MERYDIAIIGTGPAGLSAALTAKIRNKKILLLGSAGLSEKVEKAHTVQNYLGSERCGYAAGFFTAYQADGYYNYGEKGQHDLSDGRFLWYSDGHGDGTGRCCYSGNRCDGG